MGLIIGPRITAAQHRPELTGRPPLWRQLRSLSETPRQFPTLPPTAFHLFFLFFLPKFPWFFVQRRIAVFRESSCFCFSALFASPRLCSRSSEPSRKWRGSRRFRSSW